MAVTVTVNTVDYTFHFDTQVIDVQATVSSLDVYELWVAIRTAAGTSVGMAYDPIARASGLDTLDNVQNIQTFITITLFDNWEVNSLKTGGKFTLTGGNLLREDGADPFLDNPLITYFAFFSQAGTVSTVTTGSGVTEQDKIDIAALINPNIAALNDISTADIFTYSFGGYTFAEHNTIQTNANNSISDDGNGNAIIFKPDGITASLTYTYLDNGSRTLVSVDAA